MRRLLFAARLLGLLLAVAAPARAEDEPAAPPASESTPAPEPTPKWEFMLAPYLWAASVKGTFDADEVSTDVDVPFSDILDDLDAGVLAVAEARHGKLSLASNLIYMKLSDEGSNPVGPGLGLFPPETLDVNVDVQIAIFGGRAAWEVLSLPLFGAGDERRIALELGPAFRYWWIDTGADLKLKTGIPGGPFKASFDGTTNWVDFLAGGQLRAQLTKNISLVASGDYGGFGWGSSSDWTWSVGGFLSYRLFENWNLAAGWRTLEIRRGSADITMQGPLLGAAYHF